MLRAITRQQVAEIIESSYFGYENYSVQFGEVGSDMAFHVRFISDPRFTFTVKRITAMHFETTEVPGVKFLAADVLGFEGFDSVFGRLTRWLDRVHQEVVAANPFSREILELRAQLDKRLASLDEELSEFFTKSEAEELSARLSEFEQRLQDLAGENADLVQAVEGLKVTIADLKDATQSINRGMWFRMAGGRLLGGLKSLSKSKEAREFALEAAKKFLLEGSK
jgi:hypothetical protein